MLNPSSGLCFEDTRGASNKLPKRDVAAERELELPPELESRVSFGVADFGVRGVPDPRAGDLQLELEMYPALESPPEIEPEVVFELKEVPDPRADDSESLPEPKIPELAFLPCGDNNGDGGAGEIGLVALSLFSPMSYLFMISILQLPLASRGTYPTSESVLTDAWSLSRCSECPMSLGV